MAVNTHCLPTGSLGANQLSVPPVPGGPVTILTPTGSKRGVVVMFHGLSQSGNNYPPPITNGTGIAAGNAEFLTFAQNLQADGWVVIQPPQPQDGFKGGNPSQGLWNDINADAGKGSRYLATLLEWWDHVIRWANATYGAGIPIVPVGFSLGGLLSIQIAANKTSTLSAYLADFPATILSTVSPSIATNPLYMQSPVTTTLSGTPTPPFTNATISTGSNPITAGFASAGSMVIVSGTQNWQIINYTGLTASSFTGCNGGLSGSALTNGATIEQSAFTSGLDVSFTALNTITGPPGVIGWETGDIAVGYANTQLLFNNASGAGANVTSYPTSNGIHTLSNIDCAFYTGTTYNNATAYTPNQIVISGGNAYICIANSTGNTPPNATFWTLLGAQAGQGWFATTVDPLCPRVH